MRHTCRRGDVWQSLRASHRAKNKTMDLLRKTSDNARITGRSYSIAVSHVLMARRLLLDEHRRRTNGTSQRGARAITHPEYSLASDEKVLKFSRCTDAALKQLNEWWQCARLGDRRLNVIQMRKRPGLSAVALIRTVSSVVLPPVDDNVLTV